MPLVLDESGGIILDESGSAVTDDGSGWAYFNDFIGANGSTPTDFTTSETVGTGGTFDVQTNQLRLLTSATNFHTLRMVLPTSNWLDDDGALIISYLANTGLGQMNLILRGSGAWSSDMPTNGYILFLNMAGAGFEIYRVNSSVATQVGTTQAYVWSTGVFYFTRFYTLGANLKVKIWLTTDVEPEAWTYEVTDGTPYLTAGQFQMTFRTTDSAIRDLRVDAVGIQNLPIAFAPRGVGTANNATTTVSGAGASASAVVAVGVGTAEFDGEDSGSVNLEFSAAVPGGGQAYNATVSASRTLDALTKTGTANTATGSVKPNAGAAVGVGAASNATASTSTGAVSASAVTATGVGSATGITYLLDENGLPILDQNGLPIGDGAGLTVTVAPVSGVSSSTGTSHAPTRSISVPVGLAAAVGAAPSPSITTSESSSTSVTATVALSSGVANGATTTLAATPGVALAGGAAASPQAVVTVDAGVAVATGEGSGPEAQPTFSSGFSEAAGAANNATVNIDTSSTVSSATIPISATVPDPAIGVSVYPAEITVVGTASAAAQTEDQPGQLVTLRDSGHTVSLKER